MTPDEYKSLPRPKKSKFKNIRTEIDGIKFQSKREGAYYSQLKIREKAGEVYDVKLQNRHALTINGQLICTYVSDFEFYDQIEKRHRVVDVKGVRTPEFNLKKKLMKAILGIEVEIVK